MVEGGRGLQAGMQVLVLPGRDSLQWYTHTNTHAHSHSHAPLLYSVSLHLPWHIVLSASSPLPWDVSSGDRRAFAMFPAECLMPRPVLRGRLWNKRVNE